MFGFNTWILINVVIIFLNRNGREKMTRYGAV